jgi:hypothetical protein
MVASLGNPILRVAALNTTKGEIRMSPNEMLELKELQELFFIQTTLSLSQWVRLEQLEEKKERENND